MGTYISKSIAQVPDPKSIKTPDKVDSSQAQESCLGCCGIIFGQFQKSVRVTRTVPEMVKIFALFLLCGE